METEIEILKRQNDRLRKEVATKDRTLGRKNLELDALYHVWCNGGCRKGMFRYQPGQVLTQEAISLFEKNLDRMKVYFRNYEYRQKNGEQIDYQI